MATMDKLLTYEFAVDLGELDAATQRGLPDLGPRLELERSETRAGAVTYYLRHKDAGPIGALELSAREGGETRLDVHGLPAGQDGERRALLGDVLGSYRRLLGQERTWPPLSARSHEHDAEPPPDAPLFTLTWEDDGDDQEMALDAYTWFWTLGRDFSGHVTAEQVPEFFDRLKSTQSTRNFTREQTLKPIREYIESPRRSPRATIAPGMGLMIDAPKVQQEGSGRAPTRPADRQRWVEVWSKIKPWVTKWHMNAAGVVEALEEEKRVGRYRGTIYSERTMRDLIKAGKAGELDQPG